MWEAFSQTIWASSQGPLGGEMPCSSLFSVECSLFFLFFHSLFFSALIGNENQSRLLGRGCDEALFSEKRRFSVKRREAIQ